jgi:hypothetical protein
MHDCPNHTPELHTLADVLLCHTRMLNIRPPPRPQVPISALQLPSSPTASLLTYTIFHPYTRLPITLYHVLASLLLANYVFFRVCLSMIWRVVAPSTPPSIPPSSTLTSLCQPALPHATVAAAATDPCDCLRHLPNIGQSSSALQ